MSGRAGSIGAFGAALVVAAVVAGGGLFGFASWVFAVPCAAGVVCIAAGLAGAARRRRSGGSERRRARFGVEIASALVFVALNLVAVRLDGAVDVSSAGRNTLAEASVAVARGLEAPVAITALYEVDDPAFRELRALVARYQAHTSMITLQRLAPNARGGSADPGLRLEDLAADEARVVVTAGHGASPLDQRQVRLRFEAGSPAQEELLTNALVTVTTAEPARVYVTAGDGERAVDDDAPDGLSRAARALGAEGLEVVPLPLDRVEAVPDDATAVIVAAPRGASADLDERRRKLTAYIERGGRLLVLLEPHADGGLKGLLGAYGIEVVDDVVRDDSPLSALAGGPDTATGVTYAPHPITRGLEGALTHFTRARSLSINPGTPAEPLRIVETAAEARSDRGPGTTHSAGPLALALAARATGQPEARLVVFGDATFATNRGLSLGRNRDLLQNAALWLVERDDRIAVRPRGRGGSLLLLTPASRERLAFALLFVLPFSLLGVGLFVVGRRHEVR
jgi:hypothetical protein